MGRYNRKKIRIVLFALIFLLAGSNFILVQAALYPVVRESFTGFINGITNPLLTNRREISRNDTVYNEVYENYSVPNEVYGNTSVIDEVYKNSSSMVGEFMNKDYKTDRFIIKYYDGESKANLKNKIRNSISDIKNIKSLSSNLNSDVIYTKSKKSLNEFKNEMKLQKADENIKYIQPDYEMTASSEDAYFNKQWGIKNNGMEHEGYGDLLQEGTEFDYKTYNADANVVPGWEESEGDGVIVAVIDTGTDVNHEDLSQNIWRNTSEIPGNGFDDDLNGYIDDIYGWSFVDNNNIVCDQENISAEYHGTEIGGIISAIKDNDKGVAGVAPKAKIMPLKVFKNGVAYTSDIIEAIDYASKNGAKIVNCSWGTSNENPALKEAIDASTNMLFVCSAGNSNGNIDVKPVYPGAFNSENIITAASIKRNGILSGFSNYGTVSVDVAAPGEGIYSTIPGNAYGKSSGTSMSAAFVSGEAALLLSMYPDLSPTQVKQKIMGTSDRLSSLINKVNSGYKINCGNALLNISSDEIIKVNSFDDNPDIPFNNDSDGYNLYSVQGWTFKSEMPTARERLGVVKLDNKVYAIGGNKDGVCQSAVEIYDCANNTWSAKAGISIARADVKAAAVNGKIYAIGGYDSSFTDVRTVEEYNPATDTWTQKADLPTVRHGFDVAELNGKIYVIGGIAGDFAVNTVEVYDPSNNTWTSKAGMITARGYLAAAAASGKIYAVGGFANGNGTCNAVEEYDPASNTWSARASMPTDRGGLAAVSYNNMVYVFGGYQITSTNKVEEYNPSNDTWATKVNMLASRMFMGGAEVNGKIYIIGGSNGISSALKTVEEFMPTSWETKASMPTAIRYLKTAALNGKIYAVGGQIMSRAINTVEQYDLMSDTWNAKTGILAPRFLHGMAAANGKIYVLGGNDGYSILNSVEEYDPSADAWTLKSNMPTARFGFATAVVNGRIYAIGGYDGINYTAAVEEYNPVTDTWTQKADMPTSRRYLAAAAVNGKIYAIGGFIDGNYITTVEEYNPATNTWTTKTSMPAVRNALIAAEAVNGKIYILGGYYDDYISRVEEYDPLTDTWTTVEDMPTARSGLAASSINGKIYAVGGYNYDGYLSRVEEFSPTTVYGLDCAGDGKVYSLALPVKYMANFNQRTFTVRYNTNELTAVDLCGKTYKKELSTGSVAGTDITITHFAPGLIKFTVDKTVSPSKAWSGTVNIIKFKSNIAGQTKVFYYIE